MRYPGIGLLTVITCKRITLLRLHRFSLSVLLVVRLVPLTYAGPVAGASPTRRRAFGPRAPGAPLALCRQEGGKCGL